MPIQTPRCWQKQAEVSRRLAQATGDRELARKLLDLAEEFKHKAKEAERARFPGLERAPPVGTLFLIDPDHGDEHRRH